MSEKGGERRDREIEREREGHIYMIANARDVKRDSGKER